LCGTRIFAGSTLKLFNMLSATRLLNVRENLDWVTDQADKQLRHPNPLITALQECGPDEYDMNPQERKLIATGGKSVAG